MKAPSRGSRILGYALPTLAVAGGLGALSYLRDRLQHSRVFLPDRYPNGIWDPAPFGLPASDVWFEASDGVELHGWWIPHRKARGSVLYCHGNTGSIAQRIGIFRMLRRLRVNLLAFDYRGYGRSAGSPSEAGLYLDVRAAYDHLVGVLDQPPETVLLFGHSLGGAVAIDCALERQAAGLVVQSSFTHIRDAARAVLPAWPLHLVARPQFRSIDKVGRLELPKLFIHGEGDETVPFALGQLLFEAAAEPKEFYAVPHAGHKDVHRHGGLRYLYRLSRFRSRCLKTGGETRKLPSSLPA
ncbi:MAG: alpha/beta hydrolase [Thermoanaerobaculia bacterium]